MGVAESSFIASGTVRVKAAFAEEIGGEDEVSETEAVDDAEGGDITRNARV